MVSIPCLNSLIELYVFVSMAFYHRLLLFPAGFLFFALGGNSQGKTFLLILFYFPLENCVNLEKSYTFFVRKSTKKQNSTPKLS